MTVADPVAGGGEIRPCLPPPLPVTCSGQYGITKLFVSPLSA